MGKPDRDGKFSGEIVQVDEISWMWVGEGWRVVGDSVRTPGDAVPLELIDPRHDLG